MGIVIQSKAPTGTVTVRRRWIYIGAQGRNAFLGTVIGISSERRSPGAASTT